MSPKILSSPPRPLSLPEVQYLPWPFVINNPSRFSGFRRYLFITDHLVLRCTDFLEIQYDFDFERKFFRAARSSVTCAFVLCFRCETSCGLVFPFNSRPLVELPTGPTTVRRMCAPYIVPTAPVVPRALHTIFPLTEDDIPKFKDLYRSVNGNLSSNKYGTQKAVRAGIQQQFGKKEYRQVFPIEFRFFRTILQKNLHHSTPYLTQGKFPIGAVMNGPWLPEPTSENFTSCSAIISRACQHFPHSAGFAFLLPSPPGLVFSSKNQKYECPTKLPHWVTMIQDKDVALALFEEPVAYHNSEGTLLDPPKFRTVVAFFGFHRTLLVIPRKADTFDYSVLQTLKPTQHHWIPTSQLADVVRTRGNAFVVRSKELEEKLLQVNFEQKPKSFQELYGSTRDHPHHTELMHFHHKLCDDLHVFDRLPRLRSDFVKWSLGEKTKFLAQSALDRPTVPQKRRRSTLLQRHRQVCLQCHRTGHVQDECIFTCHKPIGLTKNQRILYNFLRRWKSPLLPLKSLRKNGKTPSLKQLLGFEKKLKDQNLYFWKVFQKKYGLTPEDVQFKKYAYGQIQLKGIPFFANLGLHPALLLQLVAGFNLPLRVDEGGDILLPPRLLMINDQKSDPELWDHFYESIDKTSAYIPCPVHHVACAENSFKVIEPTKLRQIGDARVANTAAPDFHSRLPQIDCIVDELEEGDLFVSHDFSKFYTQLVQHPVSARRHAIVVRDLNNKLLAYIPTGLVFGAKLAPFIAIAISNFLANVFRRLGLVAFAYIDDILVQVTNFLSPKKPEDRPIIEGIADWTTRMLAESGLILSRSKISAPSTTFQFLKWVISTESRVHAAPASAKLEKLFHNLAICLSTRTTSAQWMLEFSGQINHLDPSNIYVRRLIHQAAHFVKQVCQNVGRAQYHVLPAQDKRRLYPIPEKFAVLVLRWLHSTTFEVQPRGMRLEPRSYSFQKNTAWVGSADDPPTAILVSDASDSCAAGFTIVQPRPGQFSSVSAQIQVSFPEELVSSTSEASSLIRELYGIYHTLLHFGPAIIDRDIGNVRFVTDNLGAVFILNFFEHHTDPMVSHLSNKIFELLAHLGLIATFTWERRSTGKMRFADLVSKLMLSTKTHFTTAFRKTLRTAIGPNFQLVSLCHNWEKVSLSTLQDRPCVLLFPINGDLAHQYALRLLPLARDQLWLVPDFPTKFPTHKLAEAGFEHVIAGTYKSIIPSIPTTARYQLWSKKVREPTTSLSLLLSAFE